MAEIVSTVGTDAELSDALGTLPDFAMGREQRDTIEHQAGQIG